MTSLPTPEEVLRRARVRMEAASAVLSDAADHLRSDFRPGSEMTDEQAERRTRMFRAIDEAKAAVEQGLRR